MVLNYSPGLHSHLITLPSRKIRHQTRLYRIFPSLTEIIVRACLLLSHLPPKLHSLPTCVASHISLLRQNLRDPKQNLEAEKTEELSESVSWYQPWVCDSFLLGQQSLSWPADKYSNTSGWNSSDSFPPRAANKCGALTWKSARHCFKSYASINSKRPHMNSLGTGSVDNLISQTR